MTDEASARATPVTVFEVAQAYMRVWAESLGQVLGQISGSQLILDCVQEAPAEAPASGDSDLQFLVTVEGGLRGEMSLRLSPAVALAIAQLFLGETQDAAAALNSDHREAIEELLRQVAGHVASGLKPRWGDVQLRVQAASPSASSAARGWIGPRGDSPLRIWLEWTLDAVLGGALTAGPPEESPLGAAEAASATETSSPAKAEAEIGNLDLLLDVELEVMLRFGERSMALREILELGAGSVVELNRRVDEPVDLLLDGRIIAHGEVVVVDGNYGLRVLGLQPPPPG